MPPPLTAQRGSDGDLGTEGDHQWSRHPAGRLAPLHARFPDIAAHARALGADVSVILCDIDWFKIVNDTRGHLRSDRVLEAVAATVREIVRGCGRSVDERP